MAKGLPITIKCQNDIIKNDAKVQLYLILEKGDFFDCESLFNEEF